MIDANMNDQDTFNAPVNAPPFLIENELVYKHERGSIFSHNGKYMYIASNNRHFLIENRRDLVVLFFLLDENYNKIDLIINDYFLANRLPLKDIAISCLVWGNEYWCKVGLSFLSKSSSNFKEFETAIIYAKNKKSLSQKLRQELARLVSSTR